jgi:hypothetical protein
LKSSRRIPATGEFILAFIPNAFSARLSQTGDSTGRPEASRGGDMVETRVEVGSAFVAAGDLVALAVLVVSL